MSNLENEARIDVRKAVVGGLLAWVIQAIVMFVYRIP